MEDARTQMAYGLSVCDILKISDNEIQWFSGKEDYTEGIHMLQQTYQIPLSLKPCQLAFCKVARLTLDDIDSFL